MGKGIQKTETGCRPSQWFGEWAIVPEALSQYLAIVQASDIQAASAASAAMPSGALYTVSPDGMATINITGPIAKYGSSVQSLIGGSSTLEKRAALRAAQRDPEVRAIMLRVDSPGGTVSGTGDLADAVAQADQRKPVYAYIEDLGASAAYRIASRARKVYANADAQVGSIGTYTTLTDTSGAFQKDGVQVTVVRSGAFKGAGEPGTPVTEEQIAEAQRRVDAMNEQFLADVSKGRKMPMDMVRRMADGRIHMAAAAKDMGLIDGVASMEDAGRALMDEVNLADAQTRAQTAENEVKALQAKVAELEARDKQRQNEKDLAEMKAQLGAFTKLPTSAQGLAEAFLAIKSAAPDAFAVLFAQVKAWDAQAKVSALFDERGTTVGGAAKTLDINDPVQLRAAADELVAAKKAKDRPEAIKQLMREHAQEGK